jgi:hypothetical protein
LAVDRQTFLEQLRVEAKEAFDQYENDAITGTELDDRVADIYEMLCAIAVDDLGLTRETGDNDIGIARICRRADELLADVGLTVDGDWIVSDG